MRRFIVPIAVITVMIGCNNPITDPDQIRQCGLPLTQERAEALAREAVDVLPLKDPESSRIRNVMIDGPRQWKNIHGNIFGQQISFMLNAKNSYGGYTGEQRYVAILQRNGQFNTREANAWDK